jgi:hypothetical protein
VTGGYVIGSFDVYDPKTPGEPVARYRFVHQYLFNQSPESHTFLITDSTSGLVVKNLLFGHSYGYPTVQDLWQFKDWMTKGGETYIIGQKPDSIKIDWKGRLPYPEGLRGNGFGNTIRK